MTVLPWTYHNSGSVFCYLVQDMLCKVLLLNFMKPQDSSIMNHNIEPYLLRLAIHGDHHFRRVIELLKAFDSANFKPRIYPFSNAFRASLKFVIQEICC